MATIDINSVLKGIQKTAELAQKTVKDVSGRIEESVKPDKVNDAFRNALQKGQKAVGGLVATGEKAVSAFKEKQGQINRTISESEKPHDEAETSLSIHNTLKIIYCIMTVDGKISIEEEEKLNSIGKELDPLYPTYQAELLHECSAELAKSAFEEEEHYDTLHDYVGRLVHQNNNETKKSIRGRALLWDLLAIAYSDKDYSPDEKRLIRYITKCLNIDYSVLLEMENAIQALRIIEQEELDLQNANRSEEIVNNRKKCLLERKSAIIDGIQALLTD